MEGRGRRAGGREEWERRKENYYRHHVIINKLMHIPCIKSILCNLYTWSLIGKLERLSEIYISLHIIYYQPANASAW